MWNLQITKIIRWILYIPLILVAWWVILFLFGISAYNLYQLTLSTFWFIVVLLFITGISWYGFKMLSVGISIFVIKVCPNLKTGLQIFSIVSMFFTLYLLYNIWTIYADYSFKSIAISSALSLLALKFLFNILILYTIVRNDEY